MITVTKPYLPPKEDFLRYIDEIWRNNWLTNNGPFVNQLENNLVKYLKSRNFLYVSNGTIALQLAIKALSLKGDIITTPFSYVATTSSIVWENCKPLFVDIDGDTFNIDAKSIEKAISPNTTAILATHVFGNPCDIEYIESLANRYNLSVIYDAAHAFGVEYKGRSIYDYGDLSTASFHATKLFHTVEGGAVFYNDENIRSKISRLRNFGHVTTNSFDGVGINAKNSEFHAAMGIANLKYIDKTKEAYRYRWLRYRDALSSLNIQFQSIMDDCVYNYSYFPILLKDERSLIEVINEMKKEQVYCRRYFYPSLSSLNYVDHRPTPVSDNVSSRIMCIPLYDSLSIADQDSIIRILKKCLQ